MKYAEGIISYTYKYDIIWNNKDIQMEGKTLYSKQWIEKGIIFIQDICKEDGNFLSYHQFSLNYNITNACMLCAGIVNSYKRKIKNDPIYMAINLLQRPYSNFDSICFLTKDSDSRIDI